MGSSQEVTVLVVEGGTKSVEACDDKGVGGL